MCDDKVKQSRSKQQQLLNDVISLIKTFTTLNKIIPFGSQIVPTVHSSADPNDLDYFLTEETAQQIIDETGLVYNNIDIVTKPTINNQNKIKFTINGTNFDLILVRDTEYSKYANIVNKMLIMPQHNMGDREVRVSLFEAIYFAEFGTRFNNTHSEVTCEQ